MPPPDYGNALFAQKIEGLINEVRGLRGDVAEYRGELMALRTRMDVVERRTALSRASRGSGDASVTGRYAAAVVSGEPPRGVRALRWIWRARPTLTVGVLGLAVAYAIGKGVPLTKEWAGLLTGVLWLVGNAAASQRGRATQRAMVEETARVERARRDDGGE